MIRLVPQSSWRKSNADKKLTVDNWNNAFTYELVDRYRVLLSTTVSGDFSKLDVNDLGAVFKFFKFNKYVNIDLLYFKLGIDVVIDPSLSSGYFDIVVAAKHITYKSIYYTSIDRRPGSRVTIDSEHDYEGYYSRISPIYTDSISVIVINDIDNTARLFSGSISLTILADIYVDRGVELQPPEVETNPVVVEKFIGELG